MLSGKTAIVTGAGSGIGFAVTEKLAQNGVNIWAFVHHATDEICNKMSEIAVDNNVWIKPIEVELFDLDSVKVGLKKAITGGDSIDFLINNAGIPCEKSLAMTSVDDMEKSMFVNYIIPSFIMQTVSRKMAKNPNGGVIINITSRAGIECRSGVYAYGSSKAAMIWGTKAAAKELASYNIRVNGIAPGLTETKMGSLGRSEEATERYVSQNNIKRPAKTSEIAETVLFLVSDNSSYISGQIINVDGGRN